MTEPRIKIDPRQKPIYHAGARVVQQKKIIHDIDKAKFIELLFWLIDTFFVNLITYDILDNHYHIEFQIYYPEDISDEELERRFYNFYNKTTLKDKVDFSLLNDQQKQKLIERWSDISFFMKELNERFSKYYNKKYGFKGHFWDKRYFSVILESEEAILACMSYIDLNATRAGKGNPCDYSFCMIGNYCKNGYRAVSEDTLQKLTDLESRHGDTRLDEYARYIQKLYLQEENNFRNSWGFFTRSIAIGSKDFLDKIEDITNRSINKAKKFKPVFFSDHVFVY
jgi:hypothetical protein